MILPVVGETLVEFTVLLVCDVVRVPGPDGLGLVQLLLVNVLLLDLLRLLLVLGVLVFLGANVLDLWLVLAVFLLLLLICLFLFGLVVTDLLVALLLHLEGGGVGGNKKVGKV